MDSGGQGIDDDWGGVSNGWWDGVSRFHSIDQLPELWLFHFTKMLLTEMMFVLAPSHASVIYLIV